MSSPSLIEARKLSSGYGNVPVVRELDLQVSSGEVVVLLGANGAGKTTTLLTLAGELTASAGEVLWFGSPTTDPLFKRARGGLALVTEERDVFSQLSVKENLRVGRGDIEFAFELFPELATRTRQRAGLLSGGEQRMLSLARALSRRPRLLVADELSLGLAPLVVQRLLNSFGQPQMVASGCY